MFYVWNRDGTFLGSHRTQRAALDVVRQSVQRYGRDSRSVRDLEITSDKGSLGVGKELVDLAFREEKPARKRSAA